MSKRREDADTKAALHQIVQEMYTKLEQGETPSMTLPVRTKLNIDFDKKLGVYKYGKKRSTRDASSLGSAKNLLRALHMVEFIDEMIDSGKSSTLREMYYISEGWGHGKFSTQNESNNLAEDLEIITTSMREDFRLRPEEDGSRIIGNLTLNELNRRGEWMKINARDDVGDSGYGVPYNVEREKIELLDHDIDFLMAIETGGMFDRLIENGFDEEYRCGLVHLKGQPARSTRRILKRMNEEWNLPVVVFADGDPWSFRIFGSIAYGAIKTAHISEYLATPSATYLGVTADDIVAYDLPSDDLSSKDIDHTPCPKIYHIYYLS